MKFELHYNGCSFPHHSPNPKIFRSAIKRERNFRLSLKKILKSALEILDDLTEISREYLTNIDAEVDTNIMLFYLKTSHNKLCVISRLCWERFEFIGAALAKSINDSTKLKKLNTATVIINLMKINKNDINATEIFSNNLLFRLLSKFLLCDLLDLLFKLKASKLIKDTTTFFGSNPKMIKSNNDSNLDHETYYDGKLYCSIIKEFQKGFLTKISNFLNSENRSLEKFNKRFSKCRLLKYRSYENLVNFMTPKPLLENTIKTLTNLFVENFYDRTQKL